MTGLKENVIVGRLIPAGTGSVLRSLRKVAAQNDKEILEMRRQEAEANAQKQKALLEEGNTAPEMTEAE